jgi:dienelactone hydrolase
MLFGVGTDVSRHWRTGAALIAASLILAAPTRAETITVAEMLRGVTKTPEQCSFTPSAVWIKALGRSYCMRYYLALGGNDVRWPIVFLQGDRLGVLNLRTGAFAVPDTEKDVHTGDLLRFATMLARESKNTAIYLARVGIEGSSGDHRVRHSVLELEATNAALDAIKERHRFEGFHLLGQSGGAHLVAGLLGLRHDVRCAVIGSGPLVPVRRSRAADDPALEQFNPVRNIEPIVQNKAARIMVVTDPADKKVSAARQTAFVRVLQNAGRAVEHYLVQAVDENRHGVVAYSRVAMQGCLRNASAEEVAQQVERLVHLRVNAAYPRSENRGDTAIKTPDPSGGATASQGVPQR